MLEVKWNQEMPDPWTDVRKFWADVQVTRVDFEVDGVKNVLEAFEKTHVNGGAIFACFHLTDHPVLQWYGSRNRLQQIDFFRDFLTHPVVMESLPDLRITKPLLAEPELDYCGAQALDGEIADTLVSGGAYEQFPGSEEEAKALGAAFCAALFEDRFSEVTVFRSDTTWSSWFADVAWDVTWFGVDKRKSYFWLLCVTDED